MLHLCMYVGEHLSNIIIVNYELNSTVMVTLDFYAFTFSYIFIHDKYIFGNKLCDKSSSALIL